ncbi:MULTISPECIES: helix-turn-helix domain-containing protein [Paraburkholderia]|uniref:helix-turn-helix domain-containing protein n=1 Tax=Paraburkholderia TaxID=1822464 RepID=UPI0038BA855C
MNEFLLNTTAEPRLVCPDCESDQVETRYERQSFEYGPPGQSVTLTATVPVHYCRNPDCEEAFLGETAERIRHEAVCAHLGLLTPGAIKELRISKGGSASAFANATGIGTATLQRWESGAQLQSRSQDNFLRLLGIGDNYQMLIAMREGGSPSSRSTSTETQVRKFRSLSERNIESLAIQQDVFELRFHGQRKCM